MTGAWENEINDSPKINLEDIGMTLSNILSSLNTKENYFDLNENYSTIRYICAKEYSDFVYKYIEPQFYECNSTSLTNPKFILFSAPGATGKTALAMHICTITEDIMKIRQDKDEYNIGRNIRKFRLANDLTQEQTVAKLQLLGIEMSRGTYSHIECGLDNIRVQELLALAKIFHVDVADFFDGISLH